MKDSIKRWIGFMIGVIIATIVLSLWRGEDVEWTTAITLMIGGAFGILIIETIRKIIKVIKNKQQE